MTTIEQLTKVARRLTPDEIRQRLESLDTEARLLRAILRETLRGQTNQRPGHRTEATRR